MKTIAKKVATFLIKYWVKPDKNITIRRTSKGNFKWYLYAGGKLQAMSHPVQGFETMEEVHRSINRCFRFDNPSVKFCDKSEQKYQRAILKK